MRSGRVGFALSIAAAATYCACASFDASPTGSSGGDGGPSSDADGARADAARGNDAATPDDAATIADGGEVPFSCPVPNADPSAPSPMTFVDAGSDSYCIDVTEVTVLQYGFFLSSAKPADLTNVPGCAGHTNFQPGSACTGRGSDLPVGCVDWCDAFAYCKAAGRRLCGAVGGGPLSQGARSTNTDEWYVACSDRNRHPYPYGDLFDGKACNGAAREAGAPVSPGSIPTCRSSFGVFDMSGNAVEWVNSCNSGAAADYCMARGGAWTTSIAADLRCDDDHGIERDHKSGPTVGFRCCAGP